MKSIARLIQGLVIVSALTLVAWPAMVSAEDAQVFQVSGTFGCAPDQTSGCTPTQISCPPPEDQVDCAIDTFTGSLVGTDKLVTQFLYTTGQFWSYEDAVTINVTTDISGVPATTFTLVGSEHGVIDSTTGEFHGQSVSTDACGSILNIHTDGVINLDEFSDYGTYSGTLVVKSC
jgi:hypothetical protein